MCVLSPWDINLQFYSSETCLLLDLYYMTHNKKNVEDHERYSQTVYHV